MGLDVPQLDDRTFEELVADLRTRIPVHADEWTDHNAHDPGITVLEVLAWVAEADRYRLDRITEAHERAYLRLLGVEPEPPTPASARLRLDPPADLAGEPLPAGEPVAVEDVAGVVRGFETTDEVVLTGASVAAVVTESRAGRADVTAANGTAGAGFLPFGEDPTADAAMYLGFDGDPFRDASWLDLAVSYDDGVPEPASHGDETGTFTPSVALAWERYDGSGDWRRDDAWEPVTVADDGTHRLYESGTIRLSRPDDWTPEPAAILGREAPHCWLRCVLKTAGYEEPPRLDAIETNVVTAEHRTTVEGEELTRPEGGPATTARPDQTFAFEHAPVLSARVTVGGEEWDEVDSFHASGPNDRHYVLDREAGTVTFGDEVQGKIPAPDQAVVAERYVHGGGDDGNVSGSATWRLPDDPFRDVGVATESGAGGGTGAESVDEALDRLERDLRTPYRAVTAEDYRYVATHTPGLRFGRATALVEHEPVEGCAPAKTVRVVVVPYSTRPRPEPSDGFLAAVRDHLDEHRLITDRVAVEPPTYVGIGVTAEIAIAPGYVADGRTRAVEDALDAFLHPLDGYDGAGWPFGRPCYLSELYEAVEAVEGVDTVFDVDVRASGPSETDADGNVVVPETALCYPERHEVAVRRDAGNCRSDT